MAAIRVPTSGTKRHPSSGYFWSSDWERLYYTYYITGDMLSTGKMQYKAVVKIYFRYTNTWMGTGHVIKLRFTVGDGTSGWVTAKAWSDYWEGTGPHKTLTLTAEATPSALTLPWSIEWSDSGSDSSVTPLSQASKAKASGNIAIANGPSTLTLANTSINIGSSISATMTKIIDTNYHTFDITLGNNSKSYGSATSPYDTSASLSISASDFGSWFSSTDTSISPTLTMHTYTSDGILLGSQDITISINMTAAAGAPTGLALSAPTITKGQAVYTITAPTFKYGATLSGYTCTTTLGSAKINGTTVTVTIPQPASSSSITLTVVATDSRGYTVSAAKTSTYNSKSTFTASNVNIGMSMNVDVSEWVSSNTFTLTASSKNSSGTTTTKTFVTKSTEDSVSCNFTAADFGYLIPTNAKTATSTLTLISYNSAGTSLGNNTKNITLTMPESIGAPTGLGLVISSSSNTQIEVTITPPSYKYGATFSKYIITTSSGTASAVSGNTFTVTNSSGFGNGTVTISVQAEDSRGFKSDTVSIEKLNTVPKILLGGISYEKIYFNNQNAVAIYQGTTKIM